MPRIRHIIGCMTGTSLDGLDAALVRIDGTGFDMRATLLGVESRPFDEGLRSMLLSLAEGEPAPAMTYLRASRQLGTLHADVCESLASRAVPAPVPDSDIPAPAALATPPALDRPSPPGTTGLGTSRLAEGKRVAIDFVVAHGQTICHAPDNPLGGISWQLFDPWPIVRRLGVPVCYDLRQADLIAGGQGAPITPLADSILYPDHDLIVNLGGICNATWIRDRHPRRSPNIPDIRGFDLCPCNLLLDGLASALLPGERYDPEGRHAAAGTPRRRVVNALRHVIDAVGPRSQGRESLESGWVQRVSRAAPAASPPDVLASAVELICSLLFAFVAGLDEADSRIVLAGGGTLNRCLVDTIRSELSFTGSVTLSDDLGIPSQAREAMAFAVLGALSRDGIPITLPRVTGADKPGVAGAWAGLDLAPVERPASM